MLEIQKQQECEVNWQLAAEHASIKVFHFYPTLFN